MIKILIIYYIVSVFYVLYNTTKFTKQNETVNFLRILLFSPFTFPIFVFLDIRDFIENFKNVR